MATVMYTQASDITSQNPAGQNNSLYFPEWDIPITNGTDLSGVGQQTLIEISRRFGGEFQSTLKCGVKEEIHFDGNGKSILRFQAANTTDGTSTANTIAKIRVTGYGRAIDMGGGTITTAAQNSGELSIAGGTVLTNAMIDGGRFFCEYNATKLTTAKFSGCTAVVRRGLVDDAVCVVCNKANVLFARSTTTTSSGIAIDGSAGELRINNATVNWQGGVVSIVNLETPDALFNWQDMYESVTIDLVKGSAEAIWKSNLRVGATNISRFGATVTVTAITPDVSKVSEVGGWYPAP